MTEHTILSEGTFLYPFPFGERGDGLSFILFEHGRFLDSRLTNVCDKAVIATAMILQMQSFRQDPIGTLPLDEEELAALGRVDYPVDWSGIRAPGAKPENGCLQGWQPCKVEGHPDGVWRDRLYHPVILDVAMKAKRKKTEARAASHRAVLSKLRVQLGALGYGKRVCANDDFIAELDRALEGRRRSKATVREFAERIAARGEAAGFDTAAIEGPRDLGEGR